MILPALVCALGLPAGFLLIRRVPTCTVATEPPSKAAISLIIPARNEERTLPHLLRSIADAGCPLEVIVVDDHSTDGTAKLAASCGARVVCAPAKPPEWTGKCWACYQGAQSAVGQLLMFLDADTYFQPGGLDRILSRWEQEKKPRAVLSVLPYHAMVAPYEQLSLFFNMLMAAGAGGFGTIAPPRLFGQCMLISRNFYFKAGGHAAVAGVVLENLRWADKLREHGVQIVCVGGKGTLHMRMFSEGMRGMSESWAKAFAQGASDSGATVLAVSILWISSLWSTALLLAMPYDFGRLSLAVVYFLLGLQATWIARQLGDYRFLTAILFPIPLAYCCIVFARAVRRRLLGQKTMWKGREV